MFELSKRLSLIASFIKGGSAVCDVGTDHGYLPTFLYLSGKCKSVIATDINQKPLETARKNLERFGADGVKLVLCDGLSKVGRGDADTVVIAGMGGEVISGIIDRADFLRDSAVTLILQPTTSAKDLRLFLSQKGFCVEYEQAICENEKVYSVMIARFCDKPYTLSNVGRYIGLLKADSDESRKYIEKQYRIITKHANSISRVAEKQNEYEELIEISNQLKQILGG